MRKQIAGVALIAAALLAVQPLVEKEPVLSLQQTQVQPSIGEMETVKPARQVPATLVETIDGDTIKVEVMGRTETVRYLLIDTPESKKAGKCVQSYAKDSYKRNNELVKSGKIVFEFEAGNTRDIYGRLLAYVYVDGKSVQETLLQEGLARVGYIMNPPYKYLEEYKNHENLAKKNKEKIWSMQGFVTEWGFNGCEPDLVH
ncbi:thermonuclease family protein [Neobacillus sp. 3P2-tot-E-2]|uniref:thermonuclease family protein n=1 Tax=Neobacillus sp. 3P2-tot-E-2 TaxID=3132212 RepID=UPI0039A3D6EA